MAFAGNPVAFPKTLEAISKICTHKNDHASKVNETQEVFGLVFVASD